jgi:uncharacterized protein (TIGR03435 family)
MIRSFAAATFLVLLGQPKLLTQPSEFEVSTIKPASPTANGMTFGFPGPHRFTANNHTLKECVGFAYNLSPRLIVGGPAWIETDRYDIVAEIPGDARLPIERVLVMFQALLADRFQFKFHREQQERPVYNLVL